MKLTLNLLFGVAAIILANTAHAQTKKTDQIMQPPNNVVIDGNLKDWGDSLRYINPEKQIPYTLANDHENLYMAIRISDRTEQARVLNAGFTLNVDTKGKKKETFTMTFPLSDPGTKTQLSYRKDDNGDISQQDRDELMRERITTMRNIKVTGFKDVEYDMITTSNTYGFKAAVDYDREGNLVCEAAIPLKFFHADDLVKNEWAFDFKINGMQKPTTGGGQGGDMNAGGISGGRGRGSGMGGGRGGMGGGRGGRAGMRGGGATGAGSFDRSELYKSVDFWEKFYLAK